MIEIIGYFLLAVLVLAISVTVIIIVVTLYYFAKLTVSVIEEFIQTLE